MDNRVTAKQMEILKEYVRFEDGNKKKYWNCRKCLLRSSGHPNRIKAHLLGITGRGIKACPRMKEDREELARRLGGNSQPEQIVIPMEDTQSVGDLLEDNNDGPQETNAVGFEPINNTTHQGQSSQLGSTHVSFPQGGRDMGVGDPMPTRPQICLDHVNDRHRYPLQDGIAVDGVEETNAAGAEIINTIHQGQSSQVDSTQVSFQQGGMGMVMGMGDSIPPPPEVNFNHTNDQPPHPLRSDGVALSASIFDILYGVEMTSVLGSADETPLPCPPRFDSDLWKFYLELDKGSYGWYNYCISSTGEKKRKELLACLESACYEVRKYAINAPDRGTTILLEKLEERFFSKLRELVRAWVHRVVEIEGEIRGETGQGVRVLGIKRDREMNLWLGYAASLKIDVNDLDLDLDAMKAQSPEERWQLLTRFEELIKRADILIDTGTCLLKPAVPNDLFSLYCRSQLPNQITPGQLTQQV